MSALLRNAGRLSRRLASPRALSRATPDKSVFFPSCSERYLGNKSTENLFSWSARSYGAEKCMKMAPSTSVLLKDVRPVESVDEKESIHSLPKHNNLQLKKFTASMIVPALLVVPAAGAVNIGKLATKSQKPVAHWILQRATAIAIIPAILINVLTGSLYGFYALNILVPWHMSYGIEEILKDYVHNEVTQAWAVMLSRVMILTSAKYFFTEFLL